LNGCWMWWGHIAEDETEDRPWRGEESSFTYNIPVADIIHFRKDLRRPLSSCR
jgi:hypothetical protein